jgi:hypothetical protein
MNLSNSTHSVTLPEGLVWEEELTWTYRTVKEERAVSGKTVRSASTRIGGKPVTLKPPKDGSCWVLRSAIATLQAMVEADEDMTLALSEGETLAVAFRHDPAALDAKPVLGFTRRDANEWWTVTVRLSTLPA